MQGTIRRVATTTALANAEGALGSWAMGLPGFLAEVVAVNTPHCQNRYCRYLNGLRISFPYPARFEF